MPSTRILLSLLPLLYSATALPQTHANARDVRHDRRFLLDGILGPASSLLPDGIPPMPKKQSDDDPTPSHTPPAGPSSNQGSSPTGTAATVKLGTIVGVSTDAAVTITQSGSTRTSTIGLTNWLGVPYAQAPTGTLRLRKPIAPTASYSGGTLQATASAPACIQFPSTPNVDDLAQSDPLSLGALAGSSSSDTLPPQEDCLTLNIHRPDGHSDQQLPVVFYIFGGGFEFGSSNGLDPTSFLAKSKDLDLPVMLVTINYRVGGFGFLAGKELSDEGNTNLGLRDQRLALQWVADNIKAFGGDPKKVTIWGQSAGAISVLDQTIIKQGKSENGDLLFAGAIMNSGSITPAQPADSDKAQKIFDQVYDQVAKAQPTACSGVEKLDCLRSVDTAVLMSAANSLPGIFSDASVNLAYLPRPDNRGDNFFTDSPEIAVSKGDFAQVPVISSNVEDEGTLFALAAGQREIKSTEDIENYLTTTFEFPQKVVAQLVGSYDADAINAAAPKGYPGNYLLAKIIGDATFTMMRRSYLAAHSKSSPGKAWSFMDSHLKGVVALGTYHGSEMPNIFTGHQVSNTTLQAAFPAESYMSADIQERYIRFINFQDPNKSSDPAKLDPQWPAYDAAGLQMLQYTASEGVQVMKDDFRQEAYKTLTTSAGWGPNPFAI